MVARFIYRLVSLIFVLVTLLCWLIGVGAIAVQFTAHGPDLTAFCVSIWAFVMASMTMLASTEAWRAARYHHIRY
jgi:hypothetical protein